MKANTVEQYYILKWIEKNFYAKVLKITFIDRATIRIEDMNGDTATVRYKNKDNIELE